MGRYGLGDYLASICNNHDLVLGDEQCMNFG